MKRQTVLVVVCSVMLGVVPGLVMTATGAIAGPEVTGSGIIQAQEDVVISAEVPGQVMTLEVDEGREVEAGTVLARLDDALMLAQIAQAQAVVAAAEAQLAETRAGPRREEVAAAEATVDYAKAQVEIARAAVDEARANLEAAQATSRAAQARFNRLAAGPTEQQLALASQQVALAQAQLWAAQTKRDATKAGVDMPLSIPLTIGQFDLGQVVIPNPVGPTGIDVAAAEAGVLQAESAIRVAELQYDQLKGGTPAEDLAVAQAQLAQTQAAVQIAQITLERAQQAVAVAQAQVKQAEAQLALTQAGSRAGSIDAAEAQVARAKAALAVLKAQHDQLTLRSPIAGLVTERLVHEGETVVAGARLFTISTLDPVILTIYVPEASLGNVQLDQAAEVRVDAYPRRKFQGQVIYVSSQAEFTPRNVQTQEERTTTVFAVRVRIPNPEGLLRPGMPADAILSRSKF